MTLLKTLLLGAAILALTHKPQFVASQSVWPCPEPADISPCECTYDEVDLAIDMDCSAVESDEDLQSAFLAHFPFHTYRKLSIIGDISNKKRVPITVLDRDTFQNVSFSSFEITYTNLTSIAPNTFLDSVLHVVNVAVTESFINTFPFDMLINCPLLTTLTVDHNNLTFMSHIRSTSLLQLQVSHNPYLIFGDHAFFEAPNLEYLFLASIGLDYLAVETFSKQLKLKQIDLSDNLLEVLYPGTLDFSLDPDIELIKLDVNNIHTVEQVAIAGLGPGTVLEMQHNNLTDLPQQVWEPVFLQVTGPSSGILNFDDNPLICECNILWLVSEPSYLAAVSATTSCQNGMLLNQIDPAFLEGNCQ